MEFSRVPFVLGICFFCFVNFLSAQKKGIEITGTVLEGRTRQPVEFATVMARDGKTREPIAGTTTDLDGKFLVKADGQDLYLEVSFIGFVSQTIKDIRPAGGQVDLGLILLSEDSKTLEEVVVRGEKSQTQFQLDKRVFNVGEDLSSTGASALEVLNNVPSVTVNI